MATPKRGDLEVPRRPAVLKVGRGEESEDREIEFELEFLGSLSTAERFELMFRKSREMAELMKAHGHGEASPMLKRS